jgi:hypothetical protein
MALKSSRTKSRKKGYSLRNLTVTEYITASNIKCHEANSISVKLFHCLNREVTTVPQTSVVHKLCACIYHTCIFFTVLYLVLAICFHAPINCKSDFVPLFREETRLLYCGFRSLACCGLPSRSRIFLPDSLGALAGIT